MINRKIHRLSQLFLILFAITAALLFYWQVVDATYLVNRPENQRLYLAQQALHRGTIYERHGIALARTTFDESGSPRRTYPYPSLGALLGYHSWRYGNAGLEDAYNDYLNGQPMLQPVDNPIRRLLGEPVAGDDLQLTIDARIQQIVTGAMGRGPGACIVAANIAASGEASRRAWERVRTPRTRSKRSRLNNLNEPPIRLRPISFMPRRSGWSRPRTEMSRPTRCGSS